MALKRVKMEKEKDGFPVTSVREISILLNFHHANIVNVEEVVISPKCVCVCVHVYLLINMYLCVCLCPQLYHANIVDLEEVVVCPKCVCACLHVYNYVSVLCLCPHHYI